MFMEQFRKNNSIDESVDIKEDRIRTDGTNIYLTGKYNKYMKRRLKKLTVVDNKLKYGLVVNEFIVTENSNDVLILKPARGTTKELGAFIKYIVDDVSTNYCEAVRLSGDRFAINIQGASFRNILREGVNRLSNDSDSSILEGKFHFKKVIKDSNSGIVLEMKSSEPETCTTYAEYITKELTRKSLLKHAVEIDELSKDDLYEISEIANNSKILEDETEDNSFFVDSINFAKAIKDYETYDRDYFYEAKATYSNRMIISKLKKLGFIPIKGMTGDYIYVFNAPTVFIHIGLYDNDGDGQLEFVIESSSVKLNRTKLGVYEKALANILKNF